MAGNSDENKKSHDQTSPDVIKALEHIDDWSFDMFALSDATKDNPLKYLALDLFSRYEIFQNFKIAPASLNEFISRIEAGYRCFNNPYHNNLHSADVTQTVHYMISNTGLMCLLTDLEKFATLLAAMIHDYEHSGVTNNFLVITGADRALIYNDRSVQENHHISAAFRVLKDCSCNILSNLTRGEYRQLRSLVIDMVLATDMGYHFQLVKDMKNRISSPAKKVDKLKALTLLLHTCDISHPAKAWSLHLRWSDLLLEEFFRQGDKERELGLAISPLCDRYNTLVPESQIHFIDFIVEPTLSMCADMLECLLEPIVKASEIFNASIAKENSANATHETDQEVKKFRIRKPWIDYMIENKKNWKEQALKGKFILFQLNT